jgi:hypothetical protein
MASTTRILGLNRRGFLQVGSCALLPQAAWSREATIRTVGITVLPEFIQSEGSDRVLRSLVEIAGANAVTTSPYVMEPADERTGSREPPIDANAGKVRILDRDLFGKRELWVRTAPSFVPDRSLYTGLRYQPPQPDSLTQREGSKVLEFIRLAKASGIKVYLQVQAASPPGYRVQFSGVLDDDQPRRFDGLVPDKRLDKNGSLASPNIRDYMAAMLTDLVRAYPQIDGFRIDWPEYPPYYLDALFVDYSLHANSAAKRLGFSIEWMQESAKSLHAKLFGKLTNRDLRGLLDDDGGRYSLLSGAATFSGVFEAMRFRATLVRELVAHARKAIDNAGGEHMELIPNAFPPPWNIVSGFPFGDWGAILNGVSIKEYTMHWAMMIRFYGDALLQANPDLDEQLLVRALVRLLDVADDSGLSHLRDYHYPEPEEAHPFGKNALQRKIRQAQEEAGTTPVYALVHGYGPVDDFRTRLQAAHAASQNGFWINRYGYLADEKLKVIREVTT